ncbi:GH36-type glycosyl hydrolase domain-containing protein [Undibacterium sp. Ji22W]|uniref:GH36-type glycosyl hydrolase domain-containing protein n=1 Tax=Undibacterium sp. Ji22W TaxID=3413038 RepID=UPI003BEF78A8
MKTKNGNSSLFDFIKNDFHIAFKTKIVSVWQQWFYTEKTPLENVNPLRAELFSALQMEQHGRYLARQHQLAPHSGRNQLLRRLADNEERIIDACAHLIAATQSGYQVTPAAEWLLDNFYVIEEQIHTAQRHFPKDYSQQLPRLLNGESRGLPRVYDLALEAIAHGDGRIDPDSLNGFISAYQETQSLMLGELWAIPIMLRLALIENLRRVALYIKQSRLHRNLACEWAQRLMTCAEENPNELILLVAEMAHSKPPLQSAFVAEFVRRIQAQNPSLLLPLSWLSQSLAESNQNIESMLQADAQHQAADQVSVSNSIASLRLLSTIDWRVFVEHLSHVEQCLRLDPSRTYQAMDFSTRDLYRHAVEELARHSAISELEVAKLVLDLSFRSIQKETDSSRLNKDVDSGVVGSANVEGNLEPSADPRLMHPGYYLIGDGKLMLEDLLDYELSLYKKWRRQVMRFPLSLYLSGILVLSLGALFLLSRAMDLEHESVYVILLTAVLGLVAISQFGVNSVNWFVTVMTTPKPLPRMDFSLGIPVESACLIAVPCMITTQNSIDELVDALELRFLGNRDPHLRFCLLSDFADAPSAEMPDDAGLLLYAEKCISLLNQKYRYASSALGAGSRVDAFIDQRTADQHTAKRAESHAGSQVDGATTGFDAQAIDFFLLFHRPRLWNPQERCWMGYERKRGKLAALNAYLRGHGSHAFSAIIGAPDCLPAMRYIITLDADTGLPRDAARKFIATMAHPLNRARYDVQLQRVVAGYGILQPRIAVSLPAETATRYELLCAGEVGIDPYTRSVSDVYQDIFGEGSFIGKGIYEIDSFELALKDRLPENRILSHDLLEGCYARAGLLSDVELHEQQPASYQADAMRRHRWIRGDWQIAAWLLRQVPAYRTASESEKMVCHNPLTPLSRWKLFDNLRRSVVPIAVSALIVVSWFFLASPYFGLAVALISLCTPYLLNLFRSLMGVFKPNQQLAWRVIAKDLFFHAQQQLTQVFLAISFLPYEAYSNLDAIARTQWRIRISGRQLLNWNPSSQTNRHPGNSWRATYRSMWISPLWSSLIFAGLVIWRPSALPAAIGILLMWFGAPLSAAWISRAPARPISQIDAKEGEYLRLLARKTWLFFERYVNAENHWLPPDNVQEFPIAVVARRTSPTNIGLSLLANLSAYDFAFISVGRLLKRTQLCIATMEKLARFQGHFYNWYDTETLSPLLPKYISTVDSGNLAGHLLVLRSGLLGIPIEPVFRWTNFDSLKDTLSILFTFLNEPTNPQVLHLRLALDDACGKADGEADSEADKEIERSNDWDNEASINTQITGGKDGRNLFGAYRHLSKIQILCDQLSASLQTQFASPLDLPKQVSLQLWCDALTEQCRDSLDDLVFRCPWVVMSDRLNADQLLHFNQLSRISSHRHLVQLHEDFLASIHNFQGQEQADYQQLTAELLQQTLLASIRASTNLLEVQTLCAQLDDINQMDLGFLYNPHSRLLAIGYNHSDSRLDTSAYDLLASEARLASFVGIAQNRLPQESWFALGRQLTLANGEPILMSWSGSMFEYLMPLLVMPDYAHTLLNQSYRSAVERQISYGTEREVPWGISESGYNHVDPHLNYQYRAFGVPGLGFKRGLGDDLVIAPYASVMALMVMPKEACENLQRMSDLGFEGSYGFYEAIDYTPARLAHGQTQVVIRSFMSHHQGMSLLALAYLLLDKPLQKRFVAEPILQAALPLLHERVPKCHTTYVNTSELADIRNSSNLQEMAVRVLHRADHNTPEVQLLSNGRYHLMISSAGGSASRWNDIAINRWREDSTRDHWGSFCYLREFDSNAKLIQDFWSCTFQPTLVQPEQMEVIFSEGRAEFRRVDHQFLQHTEIILSPEDDIELRRTHITNRSRRPRILELTSYSEVVLNSAAADTMHPAFSNLFIQTEIEHERQAIICQRRPRSENEYHPCLFHLVAVHGVEIEAISYETDRAQFIGRTRDLRHPQAMQEFGALSQTEGSVLDPIVAIRVLLHLAPEQSISIDFVTGIGHDRDHAVNLIDKYRDRHLADRVIELSWTHSQVTLRQLNISESEAQTYAKLASSIIYVNPNLRATPQLLQLNRRQQSALWSYAISGDLPIVLVQIKDQANLNLIQQLISAHVYWRSKGLEVDLVIWNEEHNGYRQALQEQIMGLISALPLLHQNKSEHQAKQGGIFVRALDQISLEDRHLFLNVARICLSDLQGSLQEQMNRRPAAERILPALETLNQNAMYLTNLFGKGVKQTIGTFAQTNRERSGSRRALSSDKSVPASRDLLENNGYGGFSRNGKTYVIRSNTHLKTPAPWVNVIANAHLGTVISESGQSYSWAANAHEFRLTPWSNDAVSDAGAEVFYIRNETTGNFWSPLPRAGEGEYLCHHGFGYSEFEHEQENISSRLTVFVCVDAPIKYTILRLENLGNEKQELSVSAYVEWVLGDVRAKTQMHIHTWLETSGNTGAQTILARNPYHAEFSEFTAFYQTVGSNERRAAPSALSYSADRKEFIGRNRSLDNPQAMEKRGLSGKLGAGLDPCAAFQYVITLEPNESREFVFLLGALDLTNKDNRVLGATSVPELLANFDSVSRAHEELARVQEYWQKTLGNIQVTTPEPSFDLLANGWLLYQTLSARMWARSGFYQSGGAFGFRDQLQDAMALVHSQPQLVRQHILLAASRQFVEGDAQHWWHPPVNRGVRTRCSDDFLWLAAAVFRYVTITGDHDILDEKVFFLEGRALHHEEDSYYDLALVSAESASLYEHCIRALAHADRLGAHGLCLIGSGDWNDGFDRVGVQGKGESVWLSFFAYQCLQDFSELAQARGDQHLVVAWQSRATALQDAIEQSGWDGEWYRRAYFDDGTALGSAQNAACQIDSIAQSWSVLSGAGNQDHQVIAMQSMLDRLMQKEAGLVQLLAPPFDRDGPNPGYIRGYVPGVRENGGQYTHAAIWAVMALAKLGRNEQAWELMRMINPIHHGNSAVAIARYKVEPYVVAADVYAVAPHTGRGGWTWYTGSAGWMLRLMWESLLGLDIRADQLRLRPCIPDTWDGFTMSVHYQSSRYDITVKQMGFGETGLSLDGHHQTGDSVTMLNDGRTHVVLLLLNRDH